MAKIVLIIGGARSGKSRYAVELARKKAEKVLFVATAEVGDEEMRQRIEEHKKARPATWRTLEVQIDVGKRIQQELGDAAVVIVDCIALLVNNVLSRQYSVNNHTKRPKAIEKAVEDEINGLIACFRQVEANFIVVSNEVGTGIVPADEMSRLYRDLLGKANQMLAQHADEVLMMVAGIPLRIKGNDSGQ
ncbi:MAG: bifunctional adenosylcobinamide kinase/adenosylcobinamide-phosphate guanylyltransferase [Chloroflexota bacterium]|nr:bifunctional adenosylcobinamide kinase/adenosylcobinamide-phosphate guanylyltransferase [Chloroflexota bacterium]